MLCLAVCNSTFPFRLHCIPLCNSIKSFKELLKGDCLQRHVIKFDKMDEKVEWDVKRNVFPFQSDVGLSFNYWISHNEGLEALQIADVVASILHGQPSEVLSGVMAAEKVVIVAAHAVSQDDLRRYLSSCAFLSSCSSMPTLFVQRDSLLVNAEKAHSWFYNDTRVMNATLLWPSIPRTVGKRDSTFLSLIGKHLLTLSSSDDFVTFLSDEAARSTLKTIVDTVRSDCMAAYEHLPAFSREMRQESVVGYCQRHRSPESG